jgi:NDP-sugar pyrophosphorylase family protein
VKIDLGVIEVDAGNAIQAYIEKPTLHYKVSMGIYVFEPGILKYIRGKGRLDLPDLVRELKEKNEQPMAFDSRCRWLDIGRVEDYATAIETFERDRTLYLPEKGTR